MAGRMGSGGGVAGQVGRVGLGRLTGWLTVWDGGWADMGRFQRPFIQPKRVYITAE